TPSAVADAMRSRINLGLDLRGGTHLILQVQVNDAINAETDRAIQRLQEQLRSSSIPYSEISKPDPGRPDRIVVRGVPPEQAGELRRIVTEQLLEYELTSAPENSSYLTIRPQELAAMKDRAVTQAIETIRNRIDQLGVSEPIIEEHGLGDYQILVQLPGVDDPARVKQIMQSTAMLEIRQSLGGPFASQQEALASRGGVLPPDAVLLREGSLMRRAQGGSTGEAFWLVSRTAAVSGRDLRGAQATRDEFQRPAVSFDLTGDGGRRFAAFTGSHVGDSLAVILDNRVQQVATIQEQIRDQGRITGGFTEQEAQDIAMTLRSGALPAGIRYLEERTVGPSLGLDSIRSGVTATVASLIAVMAFMLFYYRAAGINANLALILNLVILLGFLGFSGATLTLPGIAGVILTVGIGVDSNVLIFERIKEELKNGKTAPSAIEQGFARAWTAILDSHVTTVVSAAILFIFGSGPVRGFAVTLVFGLVANLFTAVFVSRLIFEAQLNKMQRGAALSI
ncbi:MAG: protein translocase subunit SecD, partial [Candidatus Korobacteraceae bacterium]